MRNCPNCGSSAQVIVIDADVIGYEEDVVTIRKKYVCGCGEHFSTAQIYKALAFDYEDIINSWNENEGD